MANDLFAAAGIAAGAEAAAPARRARHTATFCRIAGGAAAFVHPCGGCGHPVAPFGHGVRLRAAIDAGNAEMAGRWLCSGCNTIAGDLL